MCCFSKVVMTIHVYLSVFLLRYNQKMQEICTQYLKNKKFSEQNGF